MARPPKYAREEDKPISVTLRLPRDLYAQAQQHAQRRQTTLTALVREGLQLRLETSTDPRDILATQDSTVGFDHRVGHVWLVATQHNGGTCVHFFFRSWHDCRKIPTYFAGLSQMARGYIHYSLSW
jgi:hypothetical protein